MFTWHVHPFIFTILCYFYLDSLSYIALILTESVLFAEEEMKTSKEGSSSLSKAHRFKGKK